MTGEFRERALRPVETGSGAVVHLGADRRLATEHWLLSTLADQQRDGARLQWQEHHVALLPLGTLFSAVRIPELVVQAVARTDHQGMTAEFLASVLDDGPVICDPTQRWFYALVPASMPARWTEAAAVWQEDLNVACLGRASFLGVPRLDCIGLDITTNSSYWTSPMQSAGELCDPMAVARMIAAAARRLSDEAEA